MKTKIAFGILLLLLVGIGYAFPMHYSGYVVNLKRVDAYHINLGLDGNGDGGAEFQAKFCASSFHYRVLRDAQLAHERVYITYHSEYGPSGIFLILDDVDIAEIQPAPDQPIWY